MQTRKEDISCKEARKILVKEIILG